MLYLFTDLDRTLLPNGHQPESPCARALFTSLADRPDVILTYVSGRSLALVQQAITEYQIPVPDYAVGDVGTALYEVTGTNWRIMDNWSAHIATGWPQNCSEISRHLDSITQLSMQEPEKQSRFKLSYYVDPSLIAPVEKAVKNRLFDEHIRAAVVSSFDETADQGFIDILPEYATKLDAVRFLSKQLKAKENEVVYCGDSGNDMPVLTSEIQSVLVANAQETVRAQAVNDARKLKRMHALYIARGKWGLNGNYSAGILEGVANFHHEAGDWIENHGLLARQ